MLQKKKILFVITQAEFGGAQRFLLELVTHLDPATFDIFVVSQPGELLRMLGARGIATKPLTWLTRDISPIHDILAVCKLRKLLKREKPNTLFLLSSKAGFLGSLAARFLTLNPKPYPPNPRVVYRIGGWAFNDPQPWFMRKLYVWAEKISARWKDVIVTNSEHDIEQATRFGITPREKLVTIYNGISCAELSFLSRGEARKELARRGNFQFSIFNFQIIGCTANFYKTKGLPYLIEAAAALHKKNLHVKFVIVGGGREHENIKTCIIEHGAEGYVFLTGHLPEAWRYLKAFDIFVLPSLKEGFPWVALEAMAAGVPVVATRVGALPEIITSGKNGLLVEPGNAARIATAIETLLENKLLRDALSAEARKTVEQRFTLNKMLKEATGFL